MISEAGTDLAITILKNHSLCAPDLILPECAKLLWKKVQRGQTSRDAAVAAARTLGLADLDIVPTRTFLATATQLAIELEYPTYDCHYPALTLQHGARLVTADDRLIGKLAQHKTARLDRLALSLADAAAAPVA